MCKVSRIHLHRGHTRRKPRQTILSPWRLTCRPGGDAKSDTRKRGKIPKQLTCKSHKEPSQRHVNRCEPSLRGTREQSKAACRMSAERTRSVKGPVPSGQRLCGRFSVPVSSQAPGQAVSTGTAAGGKPSWQRTVGHALGDEQPHGELSAHLREPASRTFFQYRVRKPPGTPSRCARGRRCPRP